MADVLDATGLRCPIPVLRARKRLKTMAPGDRLEVLTDDPVSPIDMRHFCATEGHNIVEAHEADAPYRFVIAKAG
ncbi:MAG: sulfurtransferase TusA family protein [Alphaproteobacteria bacterium]|nr:sulfurtransferase TusA family protein [Alphaproteobacteria bacterium]